MIEVAVIGAGLTGTMLAANLLRNRFPVKVHLFEKKLNVGQGLAYSSSDPRHILNSPHATMSLYADIPYHFTDWLRDHAPSIADSSFVPRQLYGQYLESELQKLKEDFTDQFHIYPDHTLTSLHYNLVDTKWAAEWEDRYLRIKFDHVFLATGWQNADPFVCSLDGYFPSPWNYLKEKKYLDHKRIAIIGSGLTAVDTIISLANHNIDIDVYSSAASFPKVHCEEKFSQLPTLPVNLLKQFKSERSIEAIYNSASEWISFSLDNGYSWQSCFGTLRKHASEIWQAWPQSLKINFAKNYLNTWNTHRHRIPVSSHQLIDSLTQAGRLNLKNHRISRIEDTSMGKVKVISPTLSPELASIAYDAVISCAGVCVDWEMPLFQQLQDAGYLEKDALGWGINVTNDGRVIRNGNVADNNLWAVGPLGVGCLFEITGVPEIRNQVSMICQHLRNFHPA